MPKPDPLLLDPSRYPFHCAIQPRYGDLDTNMHINNVALAGILEEGRVRFHHASSYNHAIAGRSAMAVSFAVEYLGQAHYPDQLDVYVGAAKVGRTSHTLSQLLIQQDRLVAYAQAVLVCVEDGQPAALPASFAEEIAPWMLKL